ncbi:hypothetical protein H1235_10200 [Pseudoxanthomonas sp. NC8]|nr:hypothetical protein H1235_10200 [Pseudoxanthomonas sp. NC8]
MTDPDKLERMRKHMLALGVSPSTAAPPLWKLLWRLGIDLPPPLFMGFWHTALLMGSFFGLFWGLFMWLFMWSRQGMPVWIMLSSAIWLACCLVCAWPPTSATWPASTAFLHGARTQVRSRERI